MRTGDTDVVALAISVVHKIRAEELWVAFGLGKHFRYIAVHNIAASLHLIRSKLFQSVMP